MSTNCVRCFRNERTEFDLLCDVCRAMGAPERAGAIMAATLPADDPRSAELQTMKEVIGGGWAGISTKGYIVDRRKDPAALAMQANEGFKIPEPKVTFHGEHRAASQFYVPPDVMEAYGAWGASCGPASLAAFCRVPVMAVRDSFPEFEAKRFVNLTMMRTAFDLARFEQYAVTFNRWPRADELGLLQVLIEGPWSEPGVPEQAALKHTHWVAVDGAEMMYDINSDRGWLTRAQWEAQIVPLLMQAHKRSTGVMPRRGMYFIRGTRAAKFAQNLL